MKPISVNKAGRVRRWLFLAAAVAVLALSESSWARPWRPGQIPNGYANNFAFVCANCHINPNGGGPRNPFGQSIEAELVRLYGNAVANPQPFWSAVLAVVDSDGDSFTNGRELGDPAGTWTPGSPDPAGEITNPGDPASRPTPPPNTPPTISLTAPGTGASFTAPASVTLEAAANDTDGTVARVDFFDGAIPVGSDSLSPYSVTTTLSLPGSHLLTAVATDDRGASSTSAVVTVTIHGSGNQAPGVLETFSVTNLNKPVPDGNAAGLSDHQTVNTAITEITALRVRLRVAGEFNGDLYGYVRHVRNGVTNFCVLLNRPGRTAPLPSGYGDAGFDVTFDDAAATGDIHAYRNVVVPTIGAPLAGSWRPDGRSLDPGLSLDTTPATTSLASFNGTNPNGEWTLYLADLESGGTNRLVSWALEITGRAVPALTWPTPADLVYGTALGPAQLNALAAVPGSYAYSPTNGTVLNAGAAQTLTLTFTPADTSTYVPVTTNVSVNVLKKALTITAANTNMVYGAALPLFSATYDGFVNGDTSASLDTPVTLTTTATGASPPGTHPILAGGASDANYAITFINGTLTITPAVTAGQVTSSANPASPGSLVTFTFQASPVAPSTAVPTGTVQFKINGENVGAPVTLTAGVASQSIATLPHGRHTISAEYAGDGNFLGTTNTLAQSQLINTAPVAGADTIERSLTNGSKVLVSLLLANDSDADGDALQLLAVSATSANGGAVTRNGDWVFYTPPAGFTNQDSFTYTIAESHGAQATGTVIVAIKVDPEPSPNLRITDLSDGSYLLRFDGIPGKTYRIEYTDDLSLQTWQPLGSGTANPFGAFEFRDAPPNGLPHRFYRSVYP
ncbi:MAG: Ig-like domain repeat protein [Verrucomicrobia bacterium]|nr:Ig-like domain repeat protein [Verrucomicrobiota bacterium]